MKDDPRHIRRMNSDPRTLTLRGFHPFFIKKIDYALTSFFKTGGISSKGETLFFFFKKKKRFWRVSIADSPEVRKNNSKNLKVSIFDF